MMKQRIRPYVCPSPNSSAPPQSSRPRAGGYALLIVMMLATILLISLSAALPDIYTAGMREREEELIFRGNEYARAIMLFRRQFRRYPISVKELLQTSGLRFLRREYPDPMSRKGKWRLIHADANGTILDSVTLRRPGAAQAGKAGGSSATEKAETPPAPGDAESRIPDAEKERTETSAFFGDGKEMQGAFIVGVASTSRRKSIRVFNGRSRYNEWEFIGVETSATAVMSGDAGQATSSPSGSNFRVNQPLMGQPSSKQ